MYASIPRHLNVVYALHVLAQSSANRLHSKQSLHACESCMYEYVCKLDVRSQRHTCTKTVAVISRIKCYKLSHNISEEKACRSSYRVRQEKEKELVVLEAHAVVYPRTVMIHPHGTLLWIVQIECIHTLSKYIPIPWVNIYTIQVNAYVYV